MTHIKIKIILFFTFICFTSTLVYSQNIVRSIKGTIFDDNNEPIPFVNIWIKNDKINIGTSSDMQGKFTVSLNGVNISDTITFSCIGYNSFYLPVSKLENSNNLKIILTQKVDILDEIVINAKKTGVSEIIKNYNKNRKKYMPQSTTEYEIFLRQFVKTCDRNINRYVAMAEAVFKVLLKNQEFLDSDCLYGNILTNPVTRKNCYDISSHQPIVEIEAHWKCPEIPTNIKYKIDSIIPLNNGFVYVISSITKTIDISDRNHEIICGEDTIVFCKTNKKGIEKIRMPLNSPARIYYITNEYKLIKYIRKSVYADREYFKYKNFYRRCISRFIEVDFQELDNIIYPVKMTVAWNYEHNKNKNEFCLIKKDITEYYMKKIEKVNISKYTNNNIFYVLYDMPITKEKTDYEDYIIYDNLRETVIEDINKK